MKKIKILLWVMVLCLGSMGLVLAGCGDTTSENTKIILSEVTHSVFYAPQYVALNLGYFQEEGLEVELINGGGADKVMTSVISGEAEIGLAGPEATIYGYLEGNPNHSVIFAQLTQRDGAFLVSREKIDSFSWDMLKGKYVIGGRVGGVPEMTFEYVLKQQGIDIVKDLTLDTSISFALTPGAFTGGTGDYVTLFEPTASNIEKQGLGYVVASIGEMSGYVPYTAYFANKDYMAENPQVIQSFTNAVYKGQQYCMTHTAAEIAEVVAPSFPDTDVALLTDAIARYMSIDAWCSDPIMEESSLEALEVIMESAGELDRRPVYEDIVDNSFAEEAMK